MATRKSRIRYEVKKQEPEETAQAAEFPEGTRITAGNETGAKPYRLLTKNHVDLNRGGIWSKGDVINLTDKRAAQMTNKIEPAPGKAESHPTPLEK